MSACGGHSPRMPAGLLDLKDSLNYGLPRADSVETILVHRAEDGQSYANNVLVTRFKGVFYCMWQSSEADEDTPDTKVLLSRSADGRSWSAPELLAAPTDSSFASPGGWILLGGSLAAIVNHICSEDRSRGGKAWYTISSDGSSWSPLQPMLMADGSQVDGLFEQDPLLLPSGRTVGAVHFSDSGGPGSSTIMATPVWTDDPSALGGWHRALFIEGARTPIEPSSYVTRNGDIVMLFRDQGSSFRKLYSISGDWGMSWSLPMLTKIPDSRSKQCAGNLPDGRSFMVWNPSGTKSRRALAIAYSDDGVRFDSASMIANVEDLPPRRFPGMHKTIGYNYPKATLATEEGLWVSCSMNKEDVVIFLVH